MWISAGKQTEFVGSVNYDHIEMYKKYHILRERFFFSFGNVTFERAQVVYSIVPTGVE